MIYNILFYDLNFIFKYPNKKWNIKYLIKNIDKYLSWDWVIENIDIDMNIEYIPFNIIEKYKYKWKYDCLCFNPNLTEEFILKHPNKPWNIKYLIKNNKIINFKALTKFKNIDEDIIDNYPNKPWDWEWLIENIEISIEKYIPLNLIEKYNYKLCYWNLSKNPNITEEFILHHPYQHWDINKLIKNNKITDFKSLSKFKYIDEDVIKKYPNKPWDWEWLIENTNDINVEKYISLDLIEKYKNKWEYQYLSENPNITERFILKYPDKDWVIEYLIKNNKITDFKSLSKFKNITQDIINQYPNKLWDWKWLIENTKISVEKYIPFNLIEKYKNKWEYQYLSENPNFTKDFILKYPDKDWDIIYLIYNNKITDFNALSKFKYINQDIIDEYSDKLWDWGWLIENTNINVERYIH